MTAWLKSGGGIAFVGGGHFHHRHFETRTLSNHIADPKTKAVTAINPVTRTLPAAFAQTIPGARTTLADRTIQTRRMAALKTSVAPIRHKDRNERDCASKERHRIGRRKEIRCGQGQEHLQSERSQPGSQTFSKHGRRKEPRRGRPARRALRRPARILTRLPRIKAPAPGTFSNSGPSGGSRSISGGGRSFSGAAPSGGHSFSGGGGRSFGGGGGFGGGGCRGRC